MRMLGPGGEGGSSGVVGKVGAGVGGREIAALPSILVCWGLGAGAPICLRARFGGTGGCGTGGAWVGRRGV